MILSSHILLLDFLRKVNYKLFSSLFSSCTRFVYWRAQWENSGHGPCFPGRWNECAVSEALSPPAAVSWGSLFPFRVLALMPSSSIPKGDKVNIWTHAFLWSLLRLFGGYSITTSCSLMTRRCRKWWKHPQVYSEKPWEWKEMNAD